MTAGGGQAALSRRLVVACAAVLLVTSGLMPFPARSEPISNPDFLRTWAREDQSVASGQVARSWLWGPAPFTAELQEPYGSSPGGIRTVQYFDKARMEINDPAAEPDRWFVTTGLLASELMTGAMQTADGAYVQRGPALIPVAGDLDDSEGPTYASFDRVRQAEPFPTGTTLVTAIDRAGHTSHVQRFARHNVLAERYVPETGHTVASVFWSFLHTSGTVVEDGQAGNGRLFEPWFYATGLPVTEAYWSSVSVGGVRKDVLIQVFERRVLTYTPSNDPAWRVELGNVGLHYYWWRYQRDSEAPSSAGQVLWAPDLSRLPGGSLDDSRWQLEQDPERGQVKIAAQPAASPGGNHLVALFWQGGSMPQGPAYAVSVDVQVIGQGEAGLGFDLAMDDGELVSMVYFGVDNAGMRYVGREYLDGRGSDFLMRPTGGLAGWNTIPGAWNTLSATVHGGRAWLLVNGEIVGEVELVDTGRVPGVSLVAVSGTLSGEPPSVTFRNLTITALASP